MSARPQGAWELGPGSGTLRLRTGVEGKAARMGHRLTLEARDWSGQATSGPDGMAVSVRAAVPGIEVVSGEGGAKPLSDKDKRTIAGNTVELLGTGDIAFASDAVEDRGASLAVTGTLTVAGVSRQVTWELAVAEDPAGTRLTGTLPVSQGAHGVKPYSTMLGQLRVTDVVDVDIDVLLSAPPT